ncbi:MAG: hypothetical protein ACK5MJ_09070, partial [Alphaproteobacteria bacterium]
METINVSSLHAQASSVGWDSAYIAKVAKFNVEMGLAPDLKTAADDVIRSFNRVLSTENKSIDQIYSLFKEGNGKQIAALLNKGQYVQVESLQLSQQALRAGYNQDHLLTLAKQIFNLTPNSERNLNISFEQAKQMIEEDSIKILNGETSFEGFPIIDKANKAQAITSIDNYAKGFNVYELKPIQQEINALNKTLYKASLTFDDLKNYKDQGMNISDIPSLKYSNINKVEKDFAKIEKMAEVSQKDFTSRMNDLKTTFTDVDDFNTGMKDTIKSVNKMSKSHLQANLNLQVKAISSSINAVRTMTVLMNLPK